MQLSINLRKLAGRYLFKILILLCIVHCALYQFCIMNHAFCVDLPVTSSFGWRVHPISGQWKFHAGVDLGYEYGTQVLALFDGVVMEAGDYGDGYGNQVLIYHSQINSYTRYGHMSTVYVQINEQVPRGSVIGRVGSTGYSTGPHLHLEYIVPSGDGKYIYTDPLQLWH